MRDEDAIKECFEVDGKQPQENGIDKFAGIFDDETLRFKLQESITSQSDSSVAVFMIDVDDFQEVHDAYGVVFADEILCEIADTLQKAFEPVGGVGRVSVDRFCGYYTGCQSAEVAQDFGREICRRVRNLFTGETFEHKVSVSVGVATYPEHADSIDDLYICANKALSSVKANGKDACELYNEVFQKHYGDGSDKMQKSVISDYNEKLEMMRNNFDDFGYELVDLVFNLMEHTKNEKSAISLLLRKVGLHYGMSVVAVKEVIDKPRTVNYSFEYLARKNYPNRLEQEWQYTEDEWKLFQKFSKNGKFLYYKSEQKEFPIQTIESPKLPFKSFYGVPIFHNGRVVGFIEYIYLEEEHEFSAAERNSLKMFTKVISAYMLNLKSAKYTAQKLEQLSDHDVLTGLMKYDLFCNKLRRAMKKGLKDNYIVVVYSDLKHFKYINETYGYDVGNRLLQRFSDKITKGVKRMIGASRVYSDNVVYAADYPTYISDERIFEEVLKQTSIINKELQDAFMDNNIAVCSGVFVIKNSQMDVEVAVSNANMARKEAKKKANDNVVLFDNEMMEAVVRQMQLNAELPAAIANKEIKVYYQPKIESGTGKIVGGEALVRWQKQDGSFIYPDQFIPGFEENGLIVDVDYCVYEAVFQMIRERVDLGLPLVPISMNISRVHLKDDAFLEFVKKLFNKYEIPPEYVEFELTESIYIENLERILVLIKELRKMGIKISMDDFGSGYSSLNVLNNLPIDILKLDRVFLDGNSLSINQKIIISCIVEMASKLDIRVVCEGVETAEQARFLTVIGCDMIQGYYYARPMPEKDFCKYMDEHIKVKSKVIHFTFDNTLTDTTNTYEGYCIGMQPRFEPGPFEGSMCLALSAQQPGNGVVDIPRDVFSNSSYTISFWAKVDYKNMWSSVVYMGFDNGFNAVMPFAGDLKPDFRIKLHTEDSDIWHDTGSVVSIASEWHYYAATYNAQTNVSILYLDDKIAGYQENVHMLSGIERILVGGDIYAKSLDGKIADFKIYNQSLSRTDINAEYIEGERRLLQEVKDVRSGKYNGYRTNY